MGRASLRTLARCCGLLSVHSLGRAGSPQVAHFAIYSSSRQGLPNSVFVSGLCALCSVWQRRKSYKVLAGRCWLLLLNIIEQRPTSVPCDLCQSHTLTRRLDVNTVYLCALAVERRTIQTKNIPDIIPLTHPTQRRLERRRRRRAPEAMERSLLLSLSSTSRSRLNVASPSRIGITHTRSHRDTPHATQTERERATATQAQRREMQPSKSLSIPVCVSPLPLPHSSSPISACILRPQLRASFAPTLHLRQDLARS